MSRKIYFLYFGQDNKYVYFMSSNNRFFERK